MRALISSLEMLRRCGRKLGPYLVLEILLPGGSLLALLLFLYRRRQHNFGKAASLIPLAAGRGFTSLFRDAYFRAATVVSLAFAGFHLDARNGVEARDAPTDIYVYR